MKYREIKTYAATILLYISKPYFLILMGINKDTNFKSASVIDDISFYKQTQDSVGEDTIDRRAILLDNGYVIEIDNGGNRSHPIKLLSIGDLEKELTIQEEILVNKNLLDRNSHTACRDWYQQIINKYSTVMPSINCVEHKLNRPL
jgi:hypothetical protein